MKNDLEYKLYYNSKTNVAALACMNGKCGSIDKAHANSDTRSKARWLEICDSRSTAREPSLQRHNNNLKTLETYEFFSSTDCLFINPNKISI